MKAVVLKRKGKKALALTQNGHYVHIKCGNDTHPGMCIEYQKAASTGTRVFIPAVAMLLCLLLSLSVFAYASPAAYVTIDINPGVELILNRFGLVIGSDALNKDGMGIINGADIRHRKLESAIENILNVAASLGYIDETDKTSVLMSVFSSDEGYGEKIEQKLTQIQSGLEAKHGINGLTTAASNMQRHDLANELGISPGKMLLIQKLEEEEEIELSFEELKDMSVKDIVSFGKAAGANRKNQEKENNANENADKVPGRDDAQNTEQEQEQNPNGSGSSNPGLDGPASDKGRSSSQSGGGKGS